MSDGTGEQILRSFLSDEESLLSTATAEAVQTGFTTTPPQLGDDVAVGVSDRRLLWFDDELETIDRSSIESVERDAVSHQSAPAIARIGSFLMIGGIVAGLVSAVFTDQPLLVSVGLAVAGILAFAATVGVARVRGDTGGGIEKHRLTIEHDGGLVLVWSTESALAELAAALDERAAPEQDRQS